MKMSQWTPQIIDFMEDATRYSSYFKVLASKISEYIAVDDVICDMGCGMGQLALELAPLVSQVDAVDCSKEAIQYVQQQAHYLECNNIVPIFQNMDEYRADHPLDLMMFCLSTSLAKAFHLAQKAGAKRFVSVHKIHAAKKGHSGSLPTTYDETSSPFGLSEDSFERFIERVRLTYGTKGINFHVTELTLEFGQPFRSLDDAVLFFKLFRNRDHPQGITPAELERILVPGKHHEFPYYYPIRRHLALFVVDTKSHSGLEENNKWAITQN